MSYSYYLKNINGYGCILIKIYKDIDIYVEKKKKKKKKKYFLKIYD